PDGREESSGAARFWGGLRALGGGLQIIAGAVVFAQVEVPVAAQVAGGIAVAHGLSDWEVGWRQVLSGRAERSAIQAGTSAVAQGLGAEKPTAEAIGTGVDIALGFVNPAGPATGLPTLAAEASGGERVMTVVVQASSVPERISQASHATHLATATMAMSSSAGGSSGSAGQGAQGPAPEPNSTP